ncbi:gamma-glutamylcyclotransferase [Pleionea litopenaei]|uniref:glutathione-specific gamma-glutamylcyclotransferase n=1 Tax=Pleionea litopenaei TaxID=3070815 RepID=A0AA51RUW8_9GAMM|nr:gamma-glutamylcyclotransferase [Pleionea sp. HL-JVS1]WMS87928.1 gamma-glutamylcyclotransferase [Pleionea sp. HL-JVS1]
MSRDTQALNQRRFEFKPTESVWIFGYGSLIHKVDFDYLESRPAAITGWARRFWQGSHDHRGTPSHPGRVLTLVKETGHRCIGMAYKINASVFEFLDHREKNGYLREAINIQLLTQTDKTRSAAVQFDSELNSGSLVEVPGIVYHASPDNEAFLGPATDQEIARQISQSHGPSGANSEYLLRLADSLRDLGVRGDHVFDIESAYWSLSTGV